MIATISQGPGRLPRTSSRYYWRILINALARERAHGSTVAAICDQCRRYAMMVAVTAKKLNRSQADGYAYLNDQRTI
jgi:hypothetical protein